MPCIMHDELPKDGSTPLTRLLVELPLRAFDVCRLWLNEAERRNYYNTYADQSKAIKVSHNQRLQLIYLHYARV